MARTHPALNSPPGSGISCPRVASARAGDPVRRRRSSATAATARSRISTGSTSAAPGAGGASRRCFQRGAAVDRRSAADEHLAAALPHIAGDYMGEHWLASFALLALLAGED